MTSRARLQRDHWRDGDLGYALVSDVDARELRQLAAKDVTPPQAPAAGRPPGPHPRPSFLHLMRQGGLRAHGDTAQGHHHRLRPRRLHRGDLRRARQLKPLLFTGLQPGGQLTITTESRTTPGFGGIMGPELMEPCASRRSASAPSHASPRRRPRRLLEAPVHRDGRRTGAYEAESRDRRDRRLGQAARLPSEHEAAWARGVSACATCDGFFFQRPGHHGGGRRRHRDGGGDSTCRRFATRSIVVHRRDTLRASKIMQERALKNPKIKFIWDSEVERGAGVTVGKVTARQAARTSRPARSASMHVDGLFVAIGHSRTPRS